MVMLIRLCIVMIYVKDEIDTCLLLGLLGIGFDANRKKVPAEWEYIL